MARKPIEGTVAENTLQYGVGGLNIDGCRVSVEDMDDYAFNMAGNQRVKGKEEGELTGMHEGGWKVDKTPKELPEGRWPANIIFECTCENPKVVADKYDIRAYNDYKNTFKSYEENDKDKGEYEIKDVETTKVIHTDPSCPCYILDKQSGKSSSKKRTNFKKDNTIWQENTGETDTMSGGFSDEGGASRFFYCPKASKKDREEGNIHPTVKPTDLMKYLIRLVTPKDGIVLDPFMGSGSTGKAAMQEGMWFVGIEREKEYYEIAKQRIEHEMDKRKFW
jgi:site-specific DNA-methyltransferase (adenine-specific)